MLLQTTNVVVVILSCAFIGSLPTPVEAGGSSSAGEFVDSGHLIWTTIAQTSRSKWTHQAPTPGNTHSFRAGRKKRRLCCIFKKH